MTPDQINGLFEAVSGLMILTNCWRLHRDKMVRGVNLFPVVFFTLWGVWNLIYYPSLHQYWSLVGGVVIVIANSFWLSLAWNYGRLKHS